MSLLQDLIAKKLLREAQSTSMSTLAEKIARTESHQDAIKNEVNTNIKENEPSTSTELKTALTGILPTVKPSLMDILRAKQRNQPTLPVNTTLSPLELRIQAMKAELASLELQELKETTQREVAFQAMETNDNINSKIEVTEGTVVKEYKEEVQGNIKDKLAESLIPIVQKQFSLKELLEQRTGTKTTTVIEEKKINIHEVEEDDSGKVKAPHYTDSATFALDIILNDKQQASVDFIPMDKSFVVLGAAGTGKTTSERAMMHKILESPNLKTCSFKVAGELRIDAPSVAIVAYTRRAAANSAKAILRDPILRESLPHNIMTIHALLEFVPEEYFDVADQKMKFRFAPKRNKENPLTITHLIIEEATLLGLDLWEQLYDALPYDVQIIYVGDINQLPPVFGPSILNYALTQLTVIELTQVYRQAEGSPIINNAHRILKGEMLVEGNNEMGKLVIVSGKNPTAVGQAKTAAALGVMFEQYYNMNLYNPDEDIILSPWNKRDLGTDNLNKYVAEFLSKKAGTVVYELIAGFSKVYLGVNDKVMYNKRDAVIVEIERNPAYVGRQPQVEGTDLSRWGVRRIGENSKIDLDEMAEEGEIDYSNFSIDDMGDVGMERKMQCSHRVTIAYEDGVTFTLSAVGDFAPAVFSLGYALTVHKSQGSEWRRVFIVLHKEHAISLSREMLYTAITRAREEVYLIAKRDVLDKAVVTQRVKGNTLADKIEFFNSGIQQNDSVNVTKLSIVNKYKE